MFLSHLNEVQYLSHATVKRASKRPICFATLLQNGLKNYVTRFTAHVQTFLGTNPVVVSWMDTNFWLDKTMRESRQKRESVQQPTFFQDRFDSWVACVAGAWKYWVQEKTGAREGVTRGEKELPHPSGVSFPRARSLFRPLYFQAPATQANSWVVKRVICFGRNSVKKSYLFLFPVLPYL